MKNKLTMKCNSEEIVKYIDKIFNSLIDRVTIGHELNLPFKLWYEGEYIKHYVKYRGIKALHLEYSSRFIYGSKDGSFCPIKKLYVCTQHEMPFKNKRKEKFALTIFENKFIEKTIYDLFAAATLGAGCIDFEKIIKGTAELGINDKRTPLKIIKNELERN